jgi:hypothetical protein
VAWNLGAVTRIVVAEDASAPVEQAARYLQKQVEARTGVRWELVRGGEGQVRLLVDGSGGWQPEEIGVTVDGTPDAPAVTLRAGSDATIMAAAGRFARSLHLEKGLVRAQRMGLRERPAFPVRGHVFANHKQTTTYDHWDLPHWEDYLSEIAAWGSNIAVLYPLHPARWFGVLPWGDGMQGEPWFASEQHKAEWERQWPINLALPGLVHNLGMRYGMWMPTNDVFWEEPRRHPELTKYGGAYVCCAVPEARRRIRAIREKLFSSLEHLDVLFLPSKDDGGCPGCEQCTPWGPVYLELVQEQAALARQYHPSCKLWLATQGLTASESEGLLRWLDRERPEWVEGVAYGPYSELMTFADPDDAAGALSQERFGRSGATSAGVSRIRSAVPPEYRVVLYPDATHTYRCQYPVVGMDPAVQLVWQREDGPSPRPLEYTAIHAETSIVADGSAPYTEGNTDDVNKFVWSARDWDPTRSGESVAAEYARWFFGPDVAEDAAAVILATERILNGPLYANEEVAATRALLDRVELQRPDLLENWRWLNVRLGVLMLEYIQRVLRRDRELGKQLRYRAAVWHHEPDPAPGVRQTIAFLERRFAETDALLQECVWTRDRLWDLNRLSVRGVRRLQHSYMNWDVLLEEWKAVLARMEAGELTSYPERRAALVTPLQRAEESVRTAGRGIPLVAPVQEFAWEEGETRWSWQ